MFYCRSGLISAACLAVLTLAACGKDSPTQPVSPQPQPVSPQLQPVPTSINITPASAILDAIGKTVQLTANVLDANNRPVAGTNVVWSSSSPSVATVDNRGLVRAVGAGTTQISAVVGSLRAQVVVTVVDNRIPTRIVVIPSMANLASIGATLKLSAVVRDQQNRILTDTVVSWSSTDPSVAEVDSTGLVTAKGKGMTGITAGAGTVTGTMVVTVMQSVDSITLEPAMATMTPGDTLRISAKAIDAQGVVIEEPVFFWSSEDESVATVDSEGLVLAMGAGTTRITAAASGKSSSVQVTVDENPDREALAALYNATGGPNWRVNHGWLTNEPLENWANVKINQNTRRVEVLDLGYNYLRGGIPGELGDLGGLKTLRLNDNDLSGVIPPELGKLGELETLTVEYNALSGTIPPELGKLSKITTLHLNDNHFHGPIPPELGGLRYLRSLQLGWNDLSGAIPREFVNLASLQLLDIGTNQISGPIPNELGSLANLRKLILAENQLTGSIPPELGSLTELQILSLHDNKLTGSIPPESGDLTALRILRLEGNELTGDIPSTLGELTNLEQLYLKYNELSGRIPSSIGNLDFLQTLHLNDNNLEDSIPPELGNLLNLQSLQLGWNNLSGEIPPELGSLRRLQMLDIGTNRLSGGIPPELGYLTHLVELLLAKNELTGSIPPELGDLGNLQVLSLHDNLLSGPIPDEIGRLSNLRGLRVENNQLSGTLPAELGNLSSLRILDLGGNRLTGEVPAQLTNLDNLTHLYAVNSDLCVPAETDYQSWLRNIPNKDIAHCVTVRHTLLLSPDSADLNAGETAQFTATVFNSDGGIVTDVSISWTSSDESVASVSADGLVTAQMNGTATLTAISERVSAQAELTVGPRPVPTVVRVSPSTVELLSVGASARLTAVVEDQAGRIIQDFPITWSSHNTEVATVDDRGRVVAVGEGTARLTAEAGTATHSVTVIVMQQIHSVALTTETAYLSPGDTLRIRATGIDGKGSPVEWATFDWSSDDEFVATVDTEGLVTAVDVGSAEITATVGDISAYTELTVIDDTDREVLAALYHSTNGPAWKTNSGWLSSEPLDRWHNVRTDPNSGRVVELNLTANGLDGRIPPELGSLAQLEVLHLAENALWGEIPSELGNLGDLRVLVLTDNSLFGEIPPELGELQGLSYIDFAYNNLWGEIPAELGDLRNLEILVLEYNALSGRIPSEFDNLQNLLTLQLNDNRLSGEIPVALGSLNRLRKLLLGWNGLSGTIPPEFGGLVDLKLLDLGTNQLSGDVPPELGNLHNLRSLIFAENRLTGSIPPELGNLHDLEMLSLHDNALSGTIPSALGNLANLQVLRIERNKLTGGIPPELGELDNLERLGLFENALSGELPLELANLTKLKQLVLFGTQLCAPLDTEIQDWLGTLEQSRIANCEAVYSTDGVVAYLTQAVQSLTHPVPLLADEPAMLRVFITSERGLEVDMPSVRATFFHNGSPVHTADIPGQNMNIPSEINEGSLVESVDAEVPASVVRPGLEMVLEIDPDGMLGASSGVGMRIPESGRTAVKVVEIPPLDLTLVPFLWHEDPDYSVVTVAEDLSSDHELFRQTRDNLPIVDFRLTVHDPVWTSIDPTNDNVVPLISETEMIRIVEGESGYYMGTITGVFGGYANLAGAVSVAPLTGSLMAHELGHNLSLEHAPCGRPDGIDPFYPYRNGVIGIWGFDHQTGTLVPPDTPDLMGYCGHPDDNWISDYFFSRALHYRLNEEPKILAAGLPTERTLLLSGGVDAENTLSLEPAFVVDAAPTLPRFGGSYRLSGEDAEGRSLFDLSFDMGEIAHAPDVSFFTFALPVDAEWADRLYRITLSGPEGAVSIDGVGNQASALLLDRAAGRVRGFLRDWPTQDQGLPSARRLLPEPGLDVLISRGIPRSEEWIR